jgi:hypothetical protein
MCDYKIGDTVAKRMFADKFAIVVDGGGDAEAAQQAYALRVNGAGIWCCAHIEVLSSVVGPEFNA